MIREAFERDRVEGENWRIVQIESYNKRSLNDFLILLLPSFGLNKPDANDGAKKGSRDDDAAFRVEN